MMSSQEPPLTRREARERERLRQQGSPADDASNEPPSSAAEASTSATPPHGSRRAGTVEPTPAGQMPVISTQQASDDAPEPSATLPTTSAPTTSGSAGIPSSAPEGTLTRRELRAMLATQGRVGAESSDEAKAQPVEAPAVPSPAPDRPTTPHQPFSATKIDDAAGPSLPPVGHWATDLHAPVEDDDQAFDQLLNHGGVARGAATTSNALIFPSLPVAPNGGSSPATGEIMVTGSIDLPSSFGSTGAHPEQIDSPDVDRLLDQVDDARSTGVAPVSASRSVSSQSSTHGMIAPPKREGVNAPFILAVTAGVLALGVVGLFVAGAIFNLF